MGVAQPTVSREIESFIHFGKFSEMNKSDQNREDEEDSPLKPADKNPTKRGGNE
jgi:hypothetical protein